MDYKEDELQQALDDFGKLHQRGNITVEGTILAVNDDFTCDVKIGDVEQYSVPLKVSISEQASLYEIPVINTGCLVTFRDGNINLPQIIAIDQVDQLLINCKTLVQYNKGNLGGMVKVIDLVTRMNTIESSLNALKTIFTSWVPVPNDGGSALKTLASSWAAQTITLTKRSDIEDTTITH